MKCALVLLAAALCFCSLQTCAAGEADIQNGSFLKLNMHSNKLQEALPADTADSVTVDVTVTGTGTAGAGTVTVTVTVKGTSAGTGTATGSLPGTDTNPIVLNNVASSGAKTVTGSITITGTVTGTDTFTGTGTQTGTLTDSTAIKVSIAGKGKKPATGTVTGELTITVNKGEASANTVTIGGSVTLAKKTSVDSALVQPAATEATTTTTEAPETTTTSTAAQTNAPQQSTEKPTNPTEGKTDISNSHVVSHVALFIGTIALLSVV